MDDLTGERNVDPRRPRDGHDPRAGPASATTEIVDFSGINEKGDFISLPMRTYSSGMAARLRFSIAAAKNHDVLLIDEALATGDARFRGAARSGSRELREEAGTVFLVSHSNSHDPRHLRPRALAGVRARCGWTGRRRTSCAAYEAFTKKK